MSPTDDLVVRPLQPEDRRSEFRSGNVDLDRFFHRFAGQNQFRHHIGTSWIAVRDTQILGFITVSAAHLEVGELPSELRNGLPHYPLPVLRLARLSVAAEAQGQGIGRALLRCAFAIAWRMRDDVGCVGVVVDAKPEAIEFYERLGFLSLRVTKGALGDRPEPTPMFLELASIPRVHAIPPATETP